MGAAASSRAPSRGGLQLGEVVLALAILVVAGFGLVGLLFVGLHGGHDSREQLQAATLAEYYFSTRRAAPTTDFSGTSSSEPNFPIPSLATSAQNLTAPVYVTWDGAATTLEKGDARFGLLYNIMAPSGYVPVTSPGVATVYLCIYWPPQALTGNAASGGHFEVTSSFSLP